MSVAKKESIGSDGKEGILWAEDVLVSYFWLLLCILNQLSVESSKSDFWIYTAGLSFHPGMVLLDARLMTYLYLLRHSRMPVLDRSITAWRIQALSSISVCGNYPSEKS